ncbi:hypothetical protein AVEN_150237-1 [Araneus ventricosus]|uniref:Uncharacterized protein n=1 Tax=Araneus ventricosus TaxID=182803 RepID=A0A4Y2TWQ4_ARAVE|nr:hypothetical protein AVEN_150237-1 [Araneus ventricosus]
MTSQAKKYYAQTLTDMIYPLWVNHSCRIVSLAGISDSNLTVFCHTGKIKRLSRQKCTQRQYTLKYSSSHSSTQEVKTFVQAFEGLLKCYSNNLHLYQSGLKPETEDIDESRLQLLRADRRVRVRRRPHEARDPSCQQGIGRADIVVGLGCFHTAGTGSSGKNEPIIAWKWFSLQNNVEYFDRSLVSISHTWQIEGQIMAKILSSLI